ncbi:hypothetical protein ALP77_02129 [Pseudomonas amygdali pv. tabaci]|nr:hypothetical protein ALP77_02129 [Pseudomonas amygdali pv. tabaci]RMV48663.1 hypothetical protein ALP09_00688 [Pseudomonas amygdali pv. lachrymans]
MNGMPTRSIGTISILLDTSRSSRSSVGMHFVTLRVTPVRGMNSQDYWPVTLR